MSQKLSLISCNFVTKNILTLKDSFTALADTTLMSKK
jgi:hypothetical protein